MDVAIRRTIGRPTATDLYVTAGDDVDLCIQFTDLDNKPIDITGCAFRARIGLIPPIDLSTADGTITILDAGGGVVNSPFSVPYSTPPDAYPWQIVVYDPAGKRSTVFAGSVITAAAEVSA